MRAEDRRESRREELLCSSRARCCKRQRTVAAGALAPRAPVTGLPSFARITPKGRSRPSHSQTERPRARQIISCHIREHGCGLARVRPGLDPAVSGRNRHKRIPLIRTAGRLSEAIGASAGAFFFPQRRCGPQAYQHVALTLSMRNSLSNTLHMLSNMRNPLCNVLIFFHSTGSASAAARPHLRLRMRWLPGARRARRTSRAPCHRAHRACCSRGTGTDPEHLGSTGTLTHPTHPGRERGHQTLSHRSRSEASSRDEGS